ncbi:SRPBCC domain-containing protein [Chelatococcus sp. GCM10030263]|uniref:SRPBCC family protein n=1 Tax=Chelatococcus sp. GCM10030263 TaxID=3273387 RepID=UPI003605C030
MAPPTEGPAPPSLHLRRTFDAPRELVWHAWTRPEMLIAWFGPPEWPAVHTEQDLRPGGAWRACLRSPTEDRLLWQGGIYREVVPPERLVFSFKWESDDHEDGTPVETLVTVVLTPLPDGRTQMDFTQQGLKSEQSLAGHRHGWTGTFDRLAHWLHKHGRTA